MLWLIAVSMLVVLCEEDEEDENIEQWRQDGGSRYSRLLWMENCFLGPLSCTLSMKADDGRYGWHGRHGWQASME
jgi:hypothetical protein